MLDSGNAGISVSCINAPRMLNGMLDVDLKLIVPSTPEALDRDKAKPMLRTLPQFMSIANWPGMGTVR